MPQRQPEGKIKDACRDIAKAEDLIFWQIEGKNRNGVPDTLAGRVAGGCVLIEFKVPGKEPNDQQWLRIYELREAGQLAWYATSVEEWKMLVGLEPCTIRFVYPPRILALVTLGTTADAIPKTAKRTRAKPEEENHLERWSKIISGMGVKAPSRGRGA